MDRICITQYTHNNEQIGVYKSVDGRIVMKRGEEEISMLPHEWLEYVVDVPGDYLDEELSHVVSYI